MLHYGYIAEDQYQKALNAPNTASKHEINIELYAPYVTEMVRHALSKRWGDEIYTAGLQIYTTIDTRMQRYAEEAATQHLTRYQAIFNSQFGGGWKPWETKAGITILETACKYTDRWAALKEQGLSNDKILDNFRKEDRKSVV